MARFQPAESFHSAEDTLQLLPIRFERTGKHYLVSNIVGDFVRLSGDELARLVDLHIRPGDGLYEKAYAAHLFTKVNQTAQRQLGTPASQPDGISSPTYAAAYFCRDTALRTFVSLLSGFAAKYGPLKIRHE
jgi:hypothetical protein